MKKILLISMAAVIMASCHEKKQSTETVVENKPVSIEQERFELAKKSAEKVFELMADYTKDYEAAKNKKKVADKWDKIMRPYQQTLDSLKSLLPADKVKEIDDYRQTLLNKVVNGG